MGKRAKKVTLKKMAKPKLETVFSCPLCSHEKCIECRMDRQSQVGTARCRVCSAGYQTVITYLSDPVDVYGEWVDVIAEREKSAGAAVLPVASVVGTAGKKEDGDSNKELPRFDVKSKTSSSKKPASNRKPASSKKATSSRKAKDSETEEDYKSDSDSDSESDSGSNNNDSESESEAEHSTGFESIASESDTSTAVPKQQQNTQSIDDQVDSEDDRFEALISNMHNKRASPSKTAIVESDSE